MGKAEEGQEAENIVDEIIEEGVCDGRVGLLVGSEDEHCFVETRTLEERRCLNTRPLPHCLKSRDTLQYHALVVANLSRPEAILTDRILLGYPKRWAAVSTGK